MYCGVKVKCVNNSAKSRKKEMEIIEGSYILHEVVISKICAPNGRASKCMNQKLINCKQIDKSVILVRFQYPALSNCQDKQASNQPRYRCEQHYQLNCPDLHLQSIPPSNSNMQILFKYTEGIYQYRPYSRPQTSLSEFKRFKPYNIYPQKTME